MCGINLVLNYSEVGEEAIKKMMDATTHRGPDHSGWLSVAPGIFMAANRLKIYDLSGAGNQPLVAEDGLSILIWNGALYNSQDLKNDLLEKGVIFKSHSDGEVLLHWLRLHGSEGVKQLQGMFSFAFANKNKGELIIARDPFGKKPLYYNRKGDKWLLSSEARAIVASGLSEKTLDDTQYLPYFYSRHSFPDLSFFKEVKQLMPGEVLVLDFTGRLVGKSLIKTRQEETDLPTTPQFREMVLDAVLKNFQADVPVGVVLSGGVDSSLLLHIWHQETEIPLHTFTATFAPQYQNKYNDSRFASTLAAKYRCAHHEILITPEAVIQHWDEYIASLDQPIGDSASFLTWMIAKEAKKHVKVLISGAGADELFSGYDRHKAFQWYLKNIDFLGLLARQKLLSPFSPRRLKKLLTGIAESPEETYLNFSSLQSIPVGLREKFLQYYPKLPTPYKAALAWDRQYYLVNDILKIHDNATMAHGLEGRAPYMDESLVALSDNMTEKQHLTLPSKFWLKEILKAEGWEKIASRKKLGFGMPLKEWLNKDNGFSQWVFETIRQFEATSGMGFPEEMRSLARHPERYKKDGFLQIWNLFILASWKEKQGL